jgi:hypothetical protein
MSEIVPLLPRLSWYSGIYVHLDTVAYMFEYFYYGSTVWSFMTGLWNDDAGIYSSITAE